MITTKLLAGGLLLLGIGIIIGSLTNYRPSPTSSSVVSTNLNGTPTIQPSILPTRTETSSPAVGSFLVTRVIDGDTIELEGGEKVRYIGIDTPETVDPRKPVQCFGLEASQKNKELVAGKRVWLVKDITDRDRYGRLLRYVYLGDPEDPNSMFVNLELVKEGFAHSYSYPPDIARQQEFVTAESSARSGQKGLWSKCLEGNITPFISIQPGDTVLGDVAPTGSCVIKGNIGSTGEKIYHLPGCGSYEKTSIDETHGEHWFCSEDEAIKAGWRKAKNC